MLSPLGVRASITRSLFDDMKKYEEGYRAWVPLQI
jgi:hypothetical protein